MMNDYKFLSINRCIALPVLLALASSGSAQVAMRDSVIQKYADSLSVYKEQVRLLTKENENLREANEVPDSRYMRLFTPLSFYPDMASRHFSINDDSVLLASDMENIDMALMNIYLYHPELVKRTAKTDAPIKEKKAEKKVETSALPEVIDVPQAEIETFEPMDLVIKKPVFWSYGSDINLQVMQNYFSPNWFQGHQSNYSWVTRNTFHANYNNKQKVKFENTLNVNLGFQTTQDDEFHKVKTTEDMLRYTGKLGFQAHKKWYYTVQLIGQTQLMRSYAHNSDEVKSDFLSPFTGNLSVGMDYQINWLKGRLTGSVNMAPIGMGFKYVDRASLAASHGLPEGKQSKLDYGSSITVNTTWKFSEGAKWTSRLYAYSPYNRTEVQWENTIGLKVSRFLTMQIYFYLRYDDSSISRKDQDFGYFQLQESTSFGFSYSF